MQSKNKILVQFFCSLFLASNERKRCARNNLYCKNVTHVVNKLTKHEFVIKKFP